eukprot:6191276-Pleurochrysis_carterae.AAC.1
MGVTTDRSISARSEPHHCPRHRGAASPRFRYADSNCTTAARCRDTAARCRATGSRYRCTNARNPAPSGRQLHCRPSCAYGDSREQRTRTRAAPRYLPTRPWLVPTAFRTALSPPCDAPPPLLRCGIRRRPRWLCTSRVLCVRGSAHAQTSHG